MSDSIDVEERALTLGRMLFDRLDHRSEDSLIILSHIESDFTAIGLRALRLIVAGLIRQFENRGIKMGQTVALMTFQGCNEMFSALLFTALGSMGCRVFMPMFNEPSEFSTWMDLTETRHIILPEAEVRSLEGHPREKSAVADILRLAGDRGIGCFDGLADFGLDRLIGEAVAMPHTAEIRLPDAIGSVDPEDELLIVTTSGSSGRSRLVVYAHRAYHTNCLAWQQAGFYDPAVLGGTGFTPMFTHTMGVRAFVNALWTGHPVCLVITEWFLRKPEVVRHLLLRMQPEHITGGPAVFNAFLELFRIYPELKVSLGKQLKTLVSSGARFNPDTAAEVFEATGLVLHNAFGTTETQQVFSTLVDGIPPSVADAGIPLGRPLPGVTIRLRECPGETNRHHLLIRSAFGHARILGETSDPDGYCDTGDIVTRDESGRLYFAERSGSDYFKDNFGVKIPIGMLREKYNEMIVNALHVEFYPLLDKPGIAALLFIEDSLLPAGEVTDKRTLKRFAGRIEGINNRLMNEWESFEFQHRHVSRVAMVNGPPPLTGKGTVSAVALSTTYRSLIRRLTDTRQDATGIETTDRQMAATDRYTRFVSPHIGALLEALNLDVTYHRGSKDSLFMFRHGREVEVLDLAGGYGTNLLGHNHPDVRRALNDYLSSGRPAVCSQASIQEATGRLAEKLSLAVGAATGKNFVVIPVNSGAEAVDAALQHAYYEWHNRLEKLRNEQLQLFGCEEVANVAEIWRGNMRILESTPLRVIALRQAYHGHTAGARSLLGNEKKRKLFSQLSRIEPLFLDDRDPGWREQLGNGIRESSVTIRLAVRSRGCIELIDKDIPMVIAAIAEPVVGEGGVRVVDPEFLKALAVFDFPLISDEIQCGLGRTGRFPECAGADYYLFGKALGGGFEKIAAVLIDSTRYRNTFGEHHVSTFGGGELAASVACSVLETIEKEDIATRAEGTGSFLRSRLEAIRAEYPGVIAKIDGKGLMQAVYFDPGCARKSILLRLLFETEKPGYLFASWFLNRHRIRVFPTLSAPNALRIEPSAFISEEEINRFCTTLEELCRILEEARTYDLFSVIMDDDPFDDRPGPEVRFDHYDPHLELPAGGSVRVAFVAHFAYPVREMRMLEPDMIRASDTGLRIFFRKMEGLMEMKPVQIMAANLFNGRVHFSFYVIPVDSARLEYLHRTGQRRYIVSKIQEAVDRAVAEGATVVSLGGYTSILTNNGLALAGGTGAKIITGNTLTAASGLMHLGRTLRGLPDFNRRNTIAVIGPAGNIGKVITCMLHGQEDICGRLLLVTHSEKRETEILKELENNGCSRVEVTGTRSLADAAQADVIVICTNTNDPLLFPYHIARDRPVLVSDLSVPPAVSDDVRLMPNVSVMPFSAYVRLPEDPEVVISSYSLPGTLFCCAGEAILLGLEDTGVPLKGRILPDSVREITRLAEKWGFFEGIGGMGSFRGDRIRD